MKRNLVTSALLSLLALLIPTSAGATKFLELKVVDKEYLMVHFRDGEVHYRDDATGPSAYLGHSFAEGDDTLLVFAPRLNPEAAVKAGDWIISSRDDKAYGSRAALQAFRKSKPMNTDHTLTSELDHWIFLRLPTAMKQGCSYTVSIPSGIGSDASSAEVTFDIWNTQSEAVHVNILGYIPEEPVKEADLYLWLGEGGPRDYKSFEGKKVYLYNPSTGKRSKVGNVRFWKAQSASQNEAGAKDLTGSDVWNIDFKYTAPGRYRLVVEDVGCSMDFDIKKDVYFQPFRYSVRGYYYMRLGE
ncbi:MAG: glycosyl hydrolase family 5, partial [Bacteroidales bacterium]|nr:glycosyl hydrolase family 5 [Bacteroidales bacterium]